MPLRMPRLTLLNIITIIMTMSMNTSTSIIMIMNMSMSTGIIMITNTATDIITPR